MKSYTITPDAQYTRYAKRWCKCDDFIDGEATVKQHDYDLVDSGSLASPDSYLNLINTDKNTSKNKARNKGFIKGAKLCNYSTKYLSDLMGMLFREPPKLPMPDGDSFIESLVNNVDGSGLSMSQQAQSVGEFVIRHGRRGLLTDMPRNAEGKTLTAGDVANGHRAMIKEYSAHSIVKWNTDVINGQTKLSLLVLREHYEEYTGELMLDSETKTRFLIYRYDQSGVTFETLEEDEESGFKSSGDTEPVLGAKKIPLARIPFDFVGAKNNSPSIDAPPIEDVVNLNIGHYAESANLSECTIGQSAAQPVIASNEFARIMKARSQDQNQELETGADEVIVVEQGGNMFYAQPSANTLSKEVQRGYEEQLETMGVSAKVAVNETAEAARMRKASEVANLTTISANVTDAYNNRIEDACIMMGIEFKDEYKIKINDKFFDTKFDADMIRAQNEMLDKGHISKAVFDANMVAGGQIAPEVDLIEMNEAIQLEKDTPDFEG